MLARDRAGFRSSKIGIVRIRVGDCFAIPLPNGRDTCCQYVTWNDTYGYLIRVFAKITSEIVPATDDFQNVGEMFPPVFVGLRASVTSGRWKPLGRLSVPDFEFPRFRYRHGDLSPGAYDDWMLWDGQHHQPIGRLPSELRSLEHELVWSDELLEERIATGINPFAGAQ